MKNTFAIFGLLLCLAGISCSAVGPTVLEYDFTVHPTVETVVKDGQPYLKIAGLCGHSAYGVERVKVSESGDTAHVQVYITPVSSLTNRAKVSGDFETLVPLKPGLTSVTFGKENTPIWKP